LRIYLILLLLFLICCEDIYSQTWTKFISEDNDFSVSLLGLPELKTKQLHTEIGILMSKSYNFKQDMKANNFLYSVNSVKYPPSTFHMDSLEYNEAMLTSMVEALSENLKCKIVYANTAIKNNHQALIYRLTDDVSGQVVKGFAVLKGDMIYTVHVFTMLDKSLNTDMDKFLDSFYLNND
jgi:hypothetical protein